MELLKNVFSQMALYGEKLHTSVKPTAEVSGRKVSKHAGATKRPMHLKRRERRAANKIAKASRKRNRRG